MTAKRTTPPAPTVENLVDGILDPTEPQVWITVPYSEFIVRGSWLTVFVQGLTGKLHRLPILVEAATRWSFADWPAANDGSYAEAWYTVSTSESEEDSHTSEKTPFHVGAAESLMISGPAAVVVGGTFQSTARGGRLPYSFMSSDTNVATIDVQGNGQGRLAGNAVITVTDAASNTSAHALRVIAAGPVLIDFEELSFGWLPADSVWSLAGGAATLTIGPARDRVQVSHSSEDNKIHGKFLVLMIRSGQQASARIDLVGEASSLRFAYSLGTQLSATITLWNAQGSMVGQIPAPPQYSPTWNDYTATGPFNRIEFHLRKSFDFPNTQTMILDTITLRP